MAISLKDRDIIRFGRPVELAETSDIEQFEHDDSLEGEGTKKDPLRLNVQHDESLRGSGVEGDELGVPIDGKIIKLDSEGYLTVAIGNHVNLGVVSYNLTGGLFRDDSGKLCVRTADELYTGGIRTSLTVRVDKDGIAYVPEADDETAGVIKASTTIWIDDTGSAFVPRATADSQGVIRGSNTIEIDNKGVARVPLATKTQPGVIKGSPSIEITSEGLAYVPWATENKFGIVCGSETIEINDGQASASIATGSKLGVIYGSDTIRIESDGEAYVPMATYSKYGVVAIDPDGGLMINDHAPLGALSVNRKGLIIHDDKLRGNSTEDQPLSLNLFPGAGLNFLANYPEDEAILHYFTIELSPEVAGLGFFSESFDPKYPYALRDIYFDVLLKNETGGLAIEKIRVPNPHAPAESHELMEAWQIELQLMSGDDGVILVSYPTNPAENPSVELSLADITDRVSIIQTTKAEGKRGYPIQLGDVSGRGTLVNRYVDDQGANTKVAIDLDVTTCTLNIEFPGEDAKEGSVSVDAFICSKFRTLDFEIDDKVPNPENPEETGTGYVADVLISCDDASIGVGYHNPALDEDDGVFGIHLINKMHHGFGIRRINYNNPLDQAEVQETTYNLDLSSQTLNILYPSGENVRSGPMNIEYTAVSEDRSLVVTKKQYVADALWYWDFKVADINSFTLNVDRTTGIQIEVPFAAPNKAGIMKPAASDFQMSDENVMTISPNQVKPHSISLNFVDFEAKLPIINLPAFYVRMHQMAYFFDIEEPNTGDGYMMMLVQIGQMTNARIEYTMVNKNESDPTFQWQEITFMSSWKHDSFDGKFKSHALFEISFVEANQPLDPAMITIVVHPDGEAYISANKTITTGTFFTCTFSTIAALVTPT